MSHTVEKIFSADQVRRMDERAIRQCNIPGYTLMCRAGQAMLDAIEACWPSAKRLLIVCGAGNNAGDGYVLARLARSSGYAVQLMALSEPAGLKGDAATALSDFLAGGGSVGDWDPAGLAQVDLVVDAILGTGLERPLQGRFLDAVDAINGSGKPVIAADIPSGLNANTGNVMGAAVHADLTVTFVGRKIGFYLADGPDHVGCCRFADLGVPSSVPKESEFMAQLISADLRRQVLTPRRRTSHKGDNGRVLVIGGGEGMPGAVRLAGEAALRAGAGLVTVATLPEHVPIVLASRPELICRGVRKDKDLQILLERADIIALGPGLAQNEWSQQMFRLALASGRPLVMDADALNLLADSPCRREDWVLTPHPGEAARLLGTSPSIIQNDRLSAVMRLAESYGGIAVLKGAGSLVARAGKLPWVCDQGNPGMASPGMGDVLTGIIAGLAAQCRDLEVASRLGVLAHAAAGDLAARRGERGMVAGDLMDPLRSWLNGLDEAGLAGWRS